MYFDTQALILKSEPVAEHDYLIRALSEDCGILTARLRGVRRGSSRLKIFKEPGVFADMHLWGDPGHGGVCTFLTGRALEDFGFVRRDMESWESFLGILEFTRLFSIPFDFRSREKLQLILQTLKRGVFTEESLRPALFLKIRLKILELSGWKFSDSETARRFLDAKIREFCRVFEEGSIPPLDEESRRAIEQILGLYTTSLLERKELRDESAHIPSGR
ncbi:MAG: recombination protein O N-terminal domain-containing protein [Elusimicrobia bacterium]|nr:recombination protein O N-terminal domain-containing protein [Elusimicrobiota bacterium]